MRADVYVRGGVLLVDAVMLQMALRQGSYHAMNCLFCRNISQIKYVVAFVPVLPPFRLDVVDRPATFAKPDYPTQ